MMKGSKKTAAAVAALAAAAILMLGLWYVNRPQPQTGAKTVAVEVVHADASSKEFTYSTCAQYLGELLLDEKLAEGEQGPYGLFITTVDGETAKGGEKVDTGVDATPIADGDHFELTMSTY